MKAQFPIITSAAYLDTAATSQKPVQVLDAMRIYYERFNANVHRGIHSLSVDATNMFEKTRDLLQQYFSAEEVVFTKNATEAINIVASGLELKKVVTTVLEHHSNFVPWQQKAKIFLVAGIKDEDLDVEDLLSKVEKDTTVVAFTLMSNVLGKMIDAKKIIKRIREKSDALILLDATQAAAHTKISLKDLDADFMVVSAHKMYGPTGVGALLAKTKSLTKLQPLIYGGDMIKTVAIEKTEFNDIPHNFEAGTPPIAEVIGFGEAIKWLIRNLSDIQKNEKELMKYLKTNLPDVNIIGKDHMSLLSFTAEGIHPHDIAGIMDSEEVMVRAGFHCAEPLHTALGITGCTRISLGAYNDKADIDKAIRALVKAREVFA